MKSRLGAERAGSYWGADPNDPAHKIETEFPSGRALTVASWCCLPSYFQDFPMVSAVNVTTL